MDSNKEPSRTVKTGRGHFLRRMKEDLVSTPSPSWLFEGRRAGNHSVAVSPVEAEFYNGPGSIRCPKDGVRSTSWDPKPSQAAPTLEQEHGRAYKTRRRRRRTPGS